MASKKKKKVVAKKPKKISMGVNDKYTLAKKAATSTPVKTSSSGTSTPKAVNYTKSATESIDQYNARIASERAATTPTAPVTPTPATGTPSDALKSLSVATAPVNQQGGIDYTLQPGESISDYTARIATARGETPTPTEAATTTPTDTTQQEPNQDVLNTDTFQQGGGIYQTQANGGATKVGGTGPATMTPAQALGQPSPTTPVATGVPEYVNLQGAYFRQTEQGLAAVNDAQVLNGLKTGTIPSTKTLEMPQGADSFAGVVSSQAGPTATAPASYMGAAQKFGLPPPEIAQSSFLNDPIAFISQMTTQINKAMGLDQASMEINSINNEYEKLQNKKDDEIRAVNDDPWLTEGVRVRQIQKINEKYSDREGNMTAKLQLLQDVKKDAQQQAQFALGTAVNMFDAERRFQAQQVQAYYDRAQTQFENEIALQELAMRSMPQSDATTEMKEYMFAVEQGFNGGFLDYKSAIAAAGRAPVQGEGPGYSSKQLTALTKLNENIANSDVYKKTTSMRTYINNVNAALAQQNGISDIAAINQFQKVIDEGAVTRDQDVVLIQGAQSLANQLRTKVANLEKGDKLSPAQRTQMQSLMNKIYGTQTQALSNDPYINAKKTEARLYGLTETDTVLGELGDFGGAQQAPTYGPVYTPSTNNYQQETQGIQFAPEKTITEKAGDFFKWLF